MLRRIANVSQRRGEPLRLWFSDPGLDLILWARDDGKLAGFELIYDKSAACHALTWRAGEGFRHHKVDEGEDEPLRPKRTPVLLSDGVFDKTRIRDHFLRAAGEIPPPVVKFIDRRLEAFPVDDFSEPPVLPFHELPQRT
jgi:hypothetical protein